MIKMTWTEKQRELQTETTGTKKRRSLFNFDKETKDKIKLDFEGKVDEEEKTIIFTTAKWDYKFDIPTGWRN